MIRVSLFYRFFVCTGILLSLTGCIAKNNVEVTLKNPKKKTHSILNVTVSNVQVINHQIVITGTNLNSVGDFSITQAGQTTALQIESQAPTSLVANTSSNVMFAAGKIFDFVFSAADASATFTVNFSLCDSLLGGKGFNCALTPNDKDVLSYDAVSGKWKPRPVNGLAYMGAWDALNDPMPAATSSGEYYIVGVANAPYNVGDWIVFNGTSFDRIDNSQMIVNVFGRTGAVTAMEGDYNLNKLADVDLTVAPVNGKVLKYDGAKWIAATETDPSVLSFAKAALPVCGAGEVLKSDGTNFSCVADQTGAGVFTGTANRAVVTDGTGNLVVSTITDTVLGYLSGATSNIQTQINSKLNSSSFVDWSTAGVQTIDTTRLVLPAANKVVISNGSAQPTTSAVTSTELGYLSGVTSNIQTQLNSKLSSYTETDPNVSSFAKAALPTCNAGEVLKSNGTTLSCVTDSTGAGSYTGTQNRVVLTDGVTGALTTSAVTNTEVGYVSGVTSSIQSQINSKQATVDKTTVLPVSKIRVYGANANNYVEIGAQAIGSNLLFNLPDSNGSSGNVLTTDGAGNLSWSSLATSSPVTSVNGSTGAVSLTTTNIAEGTNQYYTNARAIAAPLTGFAAGTNSAIAATDSVLNAFQKTQAQINAKFDSSSFIDWSANGAQTIHPSRLSLGVGAASKSVMTDASGFLVSGGATSTEVGYLSGVTSAIQTQLNGKQTSIDKTTTQPVSKLRIYGANANNYVELSAANLTSNHVLSFPDSDGSSGNVLVTDGAGNLSWTSLATASPVTSVNGSTGAVSLTTTNIAEGTNLYYTAARVAGDVLTAVLTGLSTATNAVISATDTVLASFGKLQAQITSLGSTKLDKTGGTLTVGTINGVPTPVNGDDVANKDYVDSFAQWVKSGANTYRATGNVGIGNNNPGSTLDVTGTIRAQSICDTSGDNCRSLSLGWQDNSWGSDSHLDQIITRLDAMDSVALGYRLWRGGGVLDSFAGTTGLDLTSSSNINVTAGYLSGSGPIDTSTATLTGNFTSNGGLTAAFDGTTIQASSASARTANSTGLIGIDLGVGITSIVTGARLWGASDKGYTGNTNTITVTIEASNNNYSNITTLATISFVNVNSSSPQSIDFANTTGYRYYRAKLTGNGSYYVAELQFETSANLNVVSNAFTASSTPASAFLAIELEELESVTANTDFSVQVSRDGGTTWTTGTLVSKGSYAESGKLYVSTIDISAQPAGTSMKYKFTTLNGKKINLHGVNFQWQ